MSIFVHPSRELAIFGLFGGYSRDTSVGKAESEACIWVLESIFCRVLDYPSQKLRRGFHHCSRPCLLLCIAVSIPQSIHLFLLVFLSAAARIFYMGLQYSSSAAFIEFAYGYTAVTEEYSEFCGQTLSGRAWEWEMDYSFNYYVAQKL